MDYDFTPALIALVIIGAAIGIALFLGIGWIVQHVRLVIV